VLIHRLGLKFLLAKKQGMKLLEKKPKLKEGIDQPNKN